MLAPHRGFCVTAASLQQVVASHPVHLLPTCFAGPLGHPLTWLFLPTGLPLAGAGSRSFCLALPSAQAAHRDHALHRLPVVAAEHSAVQQLSEGPARSHPHAVYQPGTHRFPASRQAESPQQMEAKPCSNARSIAVSHFVQETRLRSRPMRGRTPCVLLCSRRARRSRSFALCAHQLTMFLFGGGHFRCFRGKKRQAYLGRRLKLLKRLPTSGAYRYMLL